MRKSIAKRIKITKSGKWLHRHPGHNHFNAKEPRKVQHQQNRMNSLPKQILKNIKQFAVN